MWSSKVIWSEGMFLQPQHFQQQDRYVEALIDAKTRVLAPFRWGFASLSIDDAQLAGGKVVLNAAQGVLKDGTPIDIPGTDGAPDPLEVPATAKNVVVMLGLATRRAGAREASLANPKPGELTRYDVREFSAGDSTMPEQEALVQVGEKRLRLMLASDATDAYSCLGLVRILERRADNKVVIDAGYIPPTLSVRDQGMLAGYAREMLALVHQRGEALAARVGQPGPGGIAEIASYLWLQTLNRYEPLLAHLAESPMLHPERLYSALLMLAGDISVFVTESNRRPTAFAPYDHDDLENTYRPLIMDLRRSLALELQTSAIPIELQERRNNFRVALVNDKTLYKDAAFVLAANAQMPVESLRSYFPKQVKFAPVEKIQTIVATNLPGIPIRDLPVAPRQIPFHAGYTYFELDRNSEFWGQLDRSAALAMHVAGDFPGLTLELWAIRS